MTKNNITTSIDSSGNGIDVDDELQEINLNENENTNLLSRYGDYEKNRENNWFQQTEYVIFKNELKSIKNNPKTCLTPKEIKTTKHAANKVTIAVFD